MHVARTSPIRRALLSLRLRRALAGLSVGFALVACGDDAADDATDPDGGGSTSSSGGSTSSGSTSSSSSSSSGDAAPPRDAGPDAAPNDSGVASVQIFVDAFCNDNCQLQVHGDLPLGATALDADGNPIEGATFTWASSDESKATVSATGQLLGIAVGGADITATTGGVSGTYHVDVVPSQPTRIVLTPSYSRLAAAGDTVQLHAVAYDFWNYIIDVPFAWFVSDPNVGTIDANGTFTGAVQGQTTVLVGSGNAEASAQITVVAPISTTPGFALDSFEAGASVACGTVGTNAYCWGRQFEGNLGSGAPPGNIEGQGTPQLVAGNHGFTHFGIGNYHTCAITAAGEAWCWGENGSGAMGSDTAELQGSPVPVKVAGEVVFQSLVAGLSHTCGLSVTGKAYCWGDNTVGALGNGTGENTYLPTPVATDATYTQLASGLWSVCGLRPDGGVECWGQNSSGALGNGSDEGAVAPVPGELPGGHHFTQIDSYGSYTCGVELDQSIWCWGRNDLGQTGDGTYDTAYTPVQLVSAARFTQVATGAFHTCAITTSGETQCVGLGFYGGLGNGSTLDSNTTVNVVGGLRFVHLDAGSHYTCGQLASKATYCWGTGDDGQLGNGHSGGGVFATVPSPLTPPAL